MQRSILCVLVLAAWHVPSRADDEAATDREKFRGTWTFASAERDGQKLPEERLKDRKLLFTKDGYVARIGDQVVERGTHTLGESESPKALDFKITEGKDKGQTQLGIYRWDGDTLKLCLSKPGDKQRPTEFATKPDTGLALVVLRRDKP